MAPGSSAKSAADSRREHGKSSHSKLRLPKAKGQGKGEGTVRDIAQHSVTYQWHQALVCFASLCHDMHRPAIIHQMYHACYRLVTLLMVQDLQYFGSNRSDANHYMEANEVIMLVGSR